MASKWLEQQAEKSRAYVDKNYGSKSYGGSDYAPTKKQTAQAQQAYAAWQQRQQANQARQRQVAAALTLPSFQEHAARNLNLPMLPSVQLPQRPTFTQASAALPKGATSTASPQTRTARNLPTIDPSHIMTPAERVALLKSAEQQRQAQQTKQTQAARKALGNDDIAAYIQNRDAAAREMKGLTLGSVLSNPLYAAGVALENLDYGVSDVARTLLNPKKQAEINRRVAEYNAAAPATPGGASTGQMILDMANRGAANWTSGTAQTINTFAGAPLRAAGWKDNPLQRFEEAMKANQDANQARYDMDFAEANGVQRKVGDIGTSTVEALPDMVLLALSGPGKALAQGETALTRGGARLVGSEATRAGASAAAGAAATARQVAKNSLKNPMFWTSFSRVAGPSYNYAKQQGATDWEASTYATVNAILNAQVEMSGGLQTLPWELQQGGRVALLYIRSMAEEGNEEVVQGIVERTLQNLSYGADNPIFSTTDPKAIINPRTAAAEFGAGAAVSAILGAPSSVAQGVENISTREARAQEAAEAARALRVADADAARARQNDLFGAPLRAGTADTEAQSVLERNALRRGETPAHSQQTSAPATTPAGTVIQQIEAGQNPGNAALNNVMRTDDFRAAFKARTGMDIPQGMTNSQMRAFIREQLQPNREAGQEGGAAKAGGVTPAELKQIYEERFGHKLTEADLVKIGNHQIVQMLRQAMADERAGALPTQESALPSTLPTQEQSAAQPKGLPTAGNTEGSIYLNTKDGFEDVAGPRALPAQEQTAAQPKGLPAQSQQETLPAQDQMTDPAETAARAAAQPDPETRDMSDAEKADYARKLMDEGVDEQEVFRRVYGSNVFTPSPSETSSAAQHQESTPALEKLGVKVHSPIAENRDRRGVLEAHRAARKADNRLKARIRALKPTASEKAFAQGIARGVYSDSDIPSTMDSNKVEELAGLYEAAEDNSRSYIQQIRRDVKRDVRETLSGLFASANGVQVPRSFFMYLNTSQRIIRKMFKGDAGDAINEYLFDPVLRNSAEAERFKTRMFDRVREFKLTETESVLVARVLEGRAAQKEFSLLDPDMQKRVDAVARSENPAVSRSEFGLDNDEDAYQLARRYKAWLSTQARLQGQNAEKINKAADAYAAAYNDFYEAINDFLVNHGYEPIGFVQGYTPHMQSDDVKSGLSGFLRRMGLDPEVGLLPTEIAGRTDTFKPGKQWNPYFLQRQTGDPDTDYNAVEGYESYVNYMANVLYHTDDIMKLRETALYLRTRYAEDNIRSLVEQAQEVEGKGPDEITRFLIRQNAVAPGTQYTQEQAEEALDKYVDELFKDRKDKSKFGSFVSWLDDYTNRLAGKQTKFDRAFESVMGRRFLNLGNRLTKIFGESTIVGNLPSALNQTAQIPMLISEVGTANVIHAVNDILTGEVKKGDWDKQSDFLTGKRGADYLSDSSGFQKVMDFAAIPFTAVDDVTSQLYVRAKYLQCVKNGMSHEAALQAADTYVTEMVGSRIQGAKPMIFESKNIFTKAVTTFQLEIANNWAHITQDLPAQYQEYAKQNGTAKAAAKVAGDTLRYLLAAWIMNMLADKLYGGSPAPLDLIGYTFDALGADKGLTGNEYMLRAMDNLAENLTGERKLGTEEMPESVDTGAAAGALLKDVARDLPYVSNVGSAMGLVDSRMPLPAFPKNTLKDMWNMGAGGIDLLRGGDGDKAKTAAQQLPGDALKEARTWLPMGNQLYKTFTGAKALLRGGSFQGSGDKEEMQYQMPRNLMTGAKALLFGANSTKEAQDWFASGYDNLSETETKAYRQLTGNGVDEKTAYDIMRQIHGVKAEDGTKANAEKRKIITNAKMPDAQKRDLFVTMFGDSRKDELEALADAGLSFKQSMKAYNEWMRLDAIEDMTGDEKATEFAAWADSQGFTTSQATAIKDQLLFSSGYQVHAEQYEKMAAEGLSPESALTVSNALDLLEPEPGREKVLAIQKYNAVVQLDISDEEKNAALKSLMDESWRAKYEYAESIGITPSQYVASYQAIVDLRNYLNKGTTQPIVKAAVDSIPGLTTEQRAVLWQIQKLSWSPSSNPYDPRVGAIVVTLLKDKT